MELLHPPDHHDGEVEDVPGVPEVGVWMSHKAEGDNPHQTLAGEDHREDDFNFFQKLVDGICVPVGKGGEDLGTKVGLTQIASIDPRIESSSMTIITDNLPNYLTTDLIIPNWEQQGSTNRSFNNEKGVEKVLTAKETHVPVIANKMKISNHLASVIWGGKTNW